MSPGILESPSLPLLATQASLKYYSLLLTAMSNALQVILIITVNKPKVALSGTSEKAEYLMSV